MIEKIMEGRYHHLRLLLEGYTLTGIPLIEFDGTNLQPTLIFDDIGIFCIIPKIAYFLSISIDQAICGFFNTLSWVSTCVGIVGFWFLYKNYLEKVIASIGLILLTLFVCHQTMDVYRAYEAIAVATIPWGLYFIQKKYRSPYFYVFCFLSGLGIGISHYIRAHSGTAVFIFLIFLIATHALLKLHTKLTLTATLCIGMLLPVIYFNRLYTAHTQYVKENLPQCQIDDGKHVFWHAVYLGFGFLNNNLGIVFDDSLAHKKALSIKADIIYPSPESEEILKQEVFDIIKHHKLFFLYTVWAKIGILLFFLLLFANLGIPLAYLYPKDWRLESAFFIALAFSSLFMLLVIPAIGYSLGFITFSTLYGIVSINYAVEHHAIKHYSSYLKRRFFT